MKSSMWKSGSKKLKDTRSFIGQPITEKEEFVDMFGSTGSLPNQPDRPSVGNYDTLQQMVGIDEEQQRQKTMAKNNIDSDYDAVADIVNVLQPVSAHIDADSSKRRSIEGEWTLGDGLPSIQR